LVAERRASYGTTFHTSGKSVNFGVGRTRIKSPEESRVALEDLDDLSCIFSRAEPPGHSSVSGRTENRYCFAKRLSLTILPLAIAPFGTRTCLPCLTSLVRAALIRSPIASVSKLRLVKES